MISVQSNISRAFLIAFCWSLTGPLLAEAQTATEPDESAEPVAVKQPAPATALTLFQRGVLYARQNKVRDAEACYKQSAVEHPQDAVVHYYLANLLASVKRHGEAVQEYSASYLLDPYGVTSGYCRKALMLYKAPLPELPAGEIISAADRLGIKSATVEAGKNGVTKASPIRTQTEREKSRSRVAADTLSSSVLMASEAKAQKIKEAASYDVDAILHPTSPYLRRYNMMFPEQAAGAAQQVRQSADDNVKLERTLAESRAADFRRRSKDQQQALDEVASNLERQMALKAVPGSARLKEQGTSLFVRYYGNNPGSSLDVHEGVARIVPRALPDDDKQDDDRSAPVGTVRGAVLK